MARSFFALSDLHRTRICVARTVCFSNVIATISGFWLLTCMTAGAVQWPGKDSTVSALPNMLKLLIIVGQGQ